MQRKKRTCKFCDAKEIYIDYKDEKKLQRFITEQGKDHPEADYRHVRQAPTPARHRNQACAAPRPAAVRIRCSAIERRKHHESHPTKRA
jgi:hypothetical protein